MEIKDKHLDVMQNIEFAITAVYKRNPSLSDFSAMSALEALIAVNNAEKSGRPPKSSRLSPQEQTLFEGIKEMCEWRLGRFSLGESQEKTLKESGFEPEKKTVEEMIYCLRKIMKSVKFWNNQAGRQGYLNYVIRFF
jgi:hypothetical protein